MDLLRPQFVRALRPGLKTVSYLAPHLTLPVRVCVYTSSFVVLDKTGDLVCLHDWRFISCVLSRYEVKHKLLIGL